MAPGGDRDAGDTRFSPLFLLGSCPLCYRKSHTILRGKRCCLPFPLTPGSPGLGCEGTEATERGGQRAAREERQAGGEGAGLRETRRQQGGCHSLQFISSEASSQSTNWLQRLEFPMQVPSRQRNSPTPQAVSRTAPTPRPSGQSPPCGGQETPGQSSRSKAPAQAPRRAC